MLFDNYQINNHFTFSGTVLGTLIENVLILVIAAQNFTSKYDSKHHIHGQNIINYL